MITGITQKQREIIEDIEVMYTRSYDADGNLIERKGTSSEVDYGSGSWSRISRDNGATWTDWVKEFNDDEDGRRGTFQVGDDTDQILGTVGGCEPDIYDPVSGCKIGVSGFTYLLKGHKVGYFAMWDTGEDTLFNHSYFSFRKPNGELITRMIRFEDGKENYDPKNPRDMEFLANNRVAVGPIQKAPDGSFLFTVFPTMTLCCKIAGVDVNRYFPSCPNLTAGMLVAHLSWNKEKEDYDITYSNPIMLSDVQSSRGLMEPHLVFLKSGRWLIMFRGSNKHYSQWNSRIDPRMPGFKWYTVSDDNGMTFSEPAPWHFDTQEVVYSSATFSDVFRSTKTGELYWIGNIVDPTQIFGNYPRYPLQICQIDETYGYLLKDTLREIDTRREHEGSFLELSNFNLLENKETLDLEIRLTKINTHEGVRQEDGDWYCEAWEYVVSFA